MPTTFDENNLELAILEKFIAEGYELHKPEFIEMPNSFPEPFLSVY